MISWNTKELAKYGLFLADTHEFNSEKPQIILRDSSNQQKIYNETNYITPFLRTNGYCDYLGSTTIMFEFYAGVDIVQIIKID